jgi:hypothetical protein
MNKFEKLIEYIINDEDDKARALFHDIVVEKSRDIYESIMDEEQMGEMVHGGEVEDMTDEIEGEEAHMESDEEFDMDAGDEGGEDDFGGDEGGEDDFGGDDIDAGDEHGDEHEGSEIEMNIDAKLDELLAKFDEIMGDKADQDMDDMGGEEDFGGDEGGEEHDMGAEPEMMEGEQPEWLKKGSGKSGSAASGKSGSAKMEAAKAGSAVSGKSGSAKSGTSGKSGSGKMESRKGTAELMREYVDKIQDMNLTGDAEGTIVGANTGAKDKASINKKSTSLDKGPDFGGTSQNIITKKGNTNEVPDGKPVPKANNEYTKGQGQLIGKVGNTPGGDKKLSSAPGNGHGAEKNGDKETGKVVGSNQSGKPTVNKKPIEGAAGQPTGKKQ